MRNGLKRWRSIHLKTAVTCVAAAACLGGGRMAAQEPPTTERIVPPQWSEVLTSLERRASETRVAYGDSVVSIACVSRSGPAVVGGIESLRSRAGQGNVFSPQDPSYVAASYATGVVWDDRGTIITVYSGLGDPDEHDYYVWSRGRVTRGELSGLRAEVVAGEPYTNLAAIRCRDDRFADELRPIGEASKSASGEETANVADAAPAAGGIIFRLACAGPAARDGWLSVEPGGVLNVRRSLPSGAAGESGADRSLIYSHASLFQTDHASYRDAVSAAMVDLRGRFVGLQVDPREISGGEGTFALPVAGALERVADSLAEGRVADFGFLGIQPGVVTPREHGRSSGVAVEAVVEGMPADAAGLRAGDVITSVAGREVEQREAIFREVAAHPPGEEVELIVEQSARPAVTRTVRVRLTKRHVLTVRPPAAAEPPPTWRGATIDAVTALPPEQLFAQMRAVGGFSPAAAVAVDVELDSPAWAAGLRGGMRILAVDGIPVAGIEDFERLTADSTRNYRLSLQLPGGQHAETTVPAD